MTTRSGCASVLTIVWLAIAPDPAGADAPANSALAARQASEYQADTAKTIIALQPFRSTDAVVMETAGQRPGQATLINLNPRINAWYVLTLAGTALGGAGFHLENADPAGPGLHLVETGPNALGIVFDRVDQPCFLWSNAASPLEQARLSKQPYAPLCGGRLYLRNKVSGNQTDLELTTDFLRDHIWGGETIVELVRERLFRDAYLEKGGPEMPVVPTSAPPDPMAPRPALMEPGNDAESVIAEDLGIDVGVPGHKLALGRWYPATGIHGVYVGVLEPRNIVGGILTGYRDRVNAIDSVESAALDYFVAFDLSAFRVGFALGTDHPRTGWSDRPRSAEQDSLPGPDGIDRTAPLVTNGMLNPSQLPFVAATFTGGFKREHGAFRYGVLAERNHGSHYGFVEQGAIVSKLQPGLATLFVLDDDTFGLRSWTEQDETLLRRVKFARQNGVPLIDGVDPDSGVSIPGALVGQWGPGNWSGSADEKLRSVRGGVCLQEGPKQFLIYGFFSSATPSAMARVFQAFGCRYAMHLDMNAPVHTYLAVYRHQGSAILAEHLVKDMAPVDRKVGDSSIPRFLGYPDDRDFFYLTRKDRAP